MSVYHICLYIRTQGTGKLAIVDSFDIVKLLFVHPIYIQRVVGQKSTSRVFEPVADKCNVQLPVLSGTPWMMNNVMIGSYLPAIVLKQLFPGLDHLTDSLLQGKRVRQFAHGQFDKEGNDIGGFFVLSDVAAAVVYENANCAAHYANNTKQVNLLRAPSLKYIDAGHANVSLLFWVDFNFILLIYFQICRRKI